MSIPDSSAAYVHSIVGDIDGDVEINPEMKKFIIREAVKLAMANTAADPQAKNGLYANIAVQGATAAICAERALYDFECDGEIKTIADELD